MITAKEAKELYDQSGREVADYLKHNIEPEVTKAAKAGNRSVFICVDNMDRFARLEQKITPVEQYVVEELKKLGYSAVIRNHGDWYVPRGLADDNGEGPEHINYGFMIGW